MAFASIGGSRASTPPPQSYAPTSSGLQNALNPFQTQSQGTVMTQRGPVPAGGALGNVGGGGGGSAPGQATAPTVTYKPTSLDNRSQADPRMTGVFDQMSQYQAGMSAGNDQDAVLALQRQRDAMSGIAKEFGDVAASRGISGTGVESAGLSRILDPKQLSGIQAQSLSDARGRQQDMFNSRAGVAGAIAGDMRAQQDLGLQQWQTQNQLGLNAAQLEAMQRNQASQTNLDIMKLALQSMGGY